MTECTCELEHIRHATLGFPPAEDGGWPLLRTIRRPNPDRPCSVHTPICARCCLSAPGCQPAPGSRPCETTWPLITLIPPEAMSVERP